MRRLFDFLNFLIFGFLIAFGFLFLADFFGFSLGINQAIISRLLAGLLALGLVINFRKIQEIFETSNTFKKFLLLSGLNCFLFLLFLLFYPIFRFGSPFVWEDRIPNFKATQKIEITLGKPLKQTFQAKSNNLGTIGLRIISQDIVTKEEEKATVSAELTKDGTGTVRKINLKEEEFNEELNKKMSSGEQDKIVFRIKEEQDQNYFYENTYELDQYWQTGYFLFGFPLQYESQGKSYLFEIEKTEEGQTGKRFFVERNADDNFNFYPRYVYNLASLKTDREPILLNISRKTNQFLEERNTQINLIFAFLLIEFLIFIFLKKEQEQFNEKLNPYLKYGFLTGLLLITTSSLNFEFIKNINYLQMVIDNLSKYNFPLIFLTIAFGTLLFYFNRGRIEEETEKEEEQEALLEKKRFQEFPQKFPKISKVLVLRNIIRWMYKEGWGFSVPFVLITFLFIAIKIATPIIYTGSYIDEYNHIFSGIKLFEEGHFAEIYKGSYYYRGAYVSFLVGLLMFLFGKTIFVAKMLPALIGAINFFLLFFIARGVIRRKNFINLLLITYTIIPWFIFNHFYIRMYVFYEFFILFLTALFILAMKHISNVKKFASYLILIFIILFVVYFLSYDVGKFMVLLYAFFLLTYIYFFETQKINSKNIIFNYLKNKKFLKIFIYFAVLALLFFLLDGPSLIENFITGSVAFSSGKNFKYDNLFFNLNTVFSIFFLCSAGLFFLKKRKNSIKIIVFSSLIFFLIHYNSSLDLQMTRIIIYFLPLFYLVSIYSFSNFKIICKNKIIISTLFFLMAFNIYLNYPKDFLKGIYIPTEVKYIDYKKAYDFSKKNCDFLFVSSPSPFIGSFYNTDYDGIFMSSKEMIDEKFYFLKEGNYYNVFDKKIVYFNFEDINEFEFTGKKLCFFVRGETSSFLSKEDLFYLNKNFEKKEFNNVVIFTRIN